MKPKCSGGLHAGSFLLQGSLKGSLDCKLLLDINFEISMSEYVLECSAC